MSAYQLFMAIQQFPPILSSGHAIIGNIMIPIPINFVVFSLILQYSESRPGFRISFLHMDLDVEEPTLKALEALWPKVCRGGVVVFDEYAISR